jgi:hypothetical protein
MISGYRAPARALLCRSASPLKRGAAQRIKTMNARKIASKVLASIAVLAALSSLSGCVVYGRPAPARYYGWHR